MHGTHSRVGLMVFIAAYIPAMIAPVARIASERVPGMSLLALAIVVLTFGITAVSISWHGGGGAGEPLGCLAGITVWLGRLAAPAIVSWLVASPHHDLWRVIGGSTPPLCIAIGLWLHDWVRRRRSSRKA